MPHSHENGTVEYTFSLKVAKLVHKTANGFYKRDRDIILPRIISICYFLIL